MGYQRTIVPGGRSLFTVVIYERSKIFELSAAYKLGFKTLRTLSKTSL